MAYKHGKNGRVQAGASVLKAIEWDGDDATEAVHATNTESGGAQEMLGGGGISSMNGSFTAILVDGAPPPMLSGSIVALQLYEGGKTSPYAYDFDAYIANVKRHNVVKSTDPITYSCNYMSSGPIRSRPTS